MTYKLNSDTGTPQAPTRSSQATEVAVAVIFRRVQRGNYDVLVALRNVDATRGNLWEFPGGKVEPHESLVHAAQREAHEELAIELSGGTYFGSVRDEDLTQPREHVVVLHAIAFDVTDQELAPQARASQEVRWIGLHEVETLSWPRANEGVFDAFKTWLELNR